MKKKKKTKKEKESESGLANAPLHINHINCTTLLNFTAKERTSCTFK